MSNINLLPWRAKRQAQQTRRFVAQLALVVALSISALWGSLHYLQQQNEHQVLRNAQLRQASSELDDALQQLELVRLQEQQLQARQALIRQLQPRRRQTVRLLNLLPNWLPEGIRLDSLQFTPPLLEIKGHASNYEQLASLMAYLEQTAWLNAPRLQAQALLEANLAVNQPATQQFSLQLQTLEPSTKPEAESSLPPKTAPNMTPEMTPKSVAPPPPVLAVQHQSASPELEPGSPQLSASLPAFHAGPALDTMPALEPLSALDKAAAFSPEPSATISATVSATTVVNSELLNEALSETLIEVPAAQEAL